MMPMEFRCDKCGKTLLAEDPPGTEVRCPTCQASLTVPDQEAPARIDTPPTPSHEPTTPPASSKAAPEQDEDREEGQLSERTVGALAVALPWGISVVFHAGVFLVLLFLFMARAIVDETEAERIIIPDARLSETPRSMIDPDQDQLDLKKDKVRKKTRKYAYRKQQAKNMLAEIPDKKSSGLKIIGIGAGGGGQASAYGLSAGAGDGPKASFYGSGGNAYKVCYVIDRSGSLLDTFDYLRDELKRSIRALAPKQQFHVVFFAAGRPEEMPQRKLIYATQKNKDAAFEFLDAIVPGGRTDPIASLERAFKCKPELIYFMTDGDFAPDVKIKLRRLNHAKKVKINTLSFIFKPGEKLLREIAEEHGGRYKHVSEDDLDQ